MEHMFVLKEQYQEIAVHEEWYVSVSYGLGKFDRHLKAAGYAPFIVKPLLCWWSSQPGHRPRHHQTSPTAHRLHVGGENPLSDWKEKLNQGKLHYHTITPYSGRQLQRLKQSLRGDEIKGVWSSKKLDARKEKTLRRWNLLSPVTTGHNNYGYHWLSPCAGKVDTKQREQVKSCPWRFGGDVSRRRFLPVKWQWETTVQDQVSCMPQLHDM